MSDGDHQVSDGATLDHIGVKHGSDKSSLVHGYLDWYEHHLKHFRGREITLIEFCDRSVVSLLMWAEYFPKATVGGVFAHKEATLTGDKIHIEVGSQGQIEFLDRLLW